jgi:hypothetical protein
VEFASPPKEQNALALKETTVQSASEYALAIVRDVYYMKLVAVEAVSQLALDTISSIPRDSLLFSQLVTQVQEEFEHLNQCRSLLADHDAFSVTPPYVRQYARMMRSCASKPRRALPLAAAALLCIAVERSAMQQLARVSLADRNISELLRKLGTDEEDHYRLVAQVVAPCAAAGASLLERTRTYRLMLHIALITLLRWWPRQVAAYQSCGLNVGLFLEEVLDYASAALRPLGLFFPDKALLQLARLALRVS